MRRAAATKMGPNNASGIVWAISFFFSLCFCICTLLIIASTSSTTNGPNDSYHCLGHFFKEN